MKKVFSRLVIILGLFFFHVPYSFCQDAPKKEQPKKEVNKDDMDDEDNTQQQDENAPVKKTKNARARVTLALEGGVDMTALNMGGNPSNISIGGTIGAFADIRMAGRFYIQPGVFYIMNGGSDVILYNEYTGHPVEINMVEIPVTVTYKTGIPGTRTRFTVGIGGYMGYNAEADLNGVRLDIGNSAANDDIKAIEVGIGLNVGVEFRNGLFLRIKSQRGLTNLRSDPDYGSIYTGSDAITIGYLFSKKATHHRHVSTSDDAYMERRM